MRLCTWSGTARSARSLQGQLKDLVKTDLKGMVSIDIVPGVFVPRTKDKKEVELPAWCFFHSPLGPIRSLFESPRTHERPCAAIMAPARSGALGLAALHRMYRGIRAQAGGTQVSRHMCKKSSVNVAAMKKCADGDEGKALHKSQQTKEDAEPATKKFVKNTAKDSLKLMHLPLIMPRLVCLQVVCLTGKRSLRHMEHLEALRRLSQK
jgi:hypothetical protein